MPWEALIWQIPLAILTVATSIGILLKAITGSYGNIINAQTNVTNVLTERLTDSERKHINAGRKADEQQLMIQQLQKLRRRDRRECKEELEANLKQGQDELQRVKEELMTQIHECPVLMGETRAGQCPMIVPDRRHTPKSNPAQVVEFQSNHEVPSE